MIYSSRRQSEQNVSKMQAKAFTLIELLVVVAIISVLAAILFPVFARARENARKASCLSNLKQIAMGWKMYAQDYDEVLPAARWSDSSIAPKVTVDFPFLLMPYTKSMQIFDCPSTDNHYKGTLTCTPTSYVQNGYLGYGAKTPSKTTLKFYPRRLSSIQSASITPLHWDTDKNNQSVGQWNQAGMDANPSYFSERHNGMFNVSFVDGHVKSLKKEQAFVNIEPNPDNQD